VSEMLACSPRDRDSDIVRAKTSQAGRFTALLRRLVFGIAAIVLIYAGLSVEAEARCKDDPYIDHEFETAVRVPLPNRLPPEVTDGKRTFHVEMARFYSMKHFNAITNWDSRTILLADNLSIDDERETFYHELSHVAARLKESIYDGCKRRNEDQAIELISPGMVELLRKNPAVLDYLLAK
jgi:hypothetical protein